MSDLDFSHNVKEIPAAQALPNPLKRSVGIETQNIPDIQGAVHNYAENTNWMSNVGSYVAAKASDALATKLGGELGKNPQGDLGIPLTDFDKVLRKSYETQAQTTLGNQANKLITDSNIELASSPRVTPDLIASTNKQVTAGLQSIFKNAPQELRPSLELHYGTVLLNQNEHLVNRMLGEQKEDRQGNLELSVKTAAQNTYSFGISNTNLDKNGDSKAALDLIKTAEKMASVSLAMHDITPLKAKVMVDTVRQSYLSGKTIREGLAAEKAGNLGEYEKKLSERTDISNEDREAVLHNFSTYFNNQKALRNDSENLTSQLMYNRIISDPTSISGSDWATFQESVSPLKAAQMDFHRIQVLNRKTSTGAGVSNLKAHYGDARVQANASPEIKNAAFNESVASIMKENPNTTQAKAENIVASSAGAPAPVFTKTLSGGLWSGDPAQMIEKAQQIDELQGDGNGHALTDLSEADLALASDISHNKNETDPAWSTRMVAENRLNQDETVRKNSEAAFSAHVYANTIKNNTTEDDWILGKFDMKGGMFSTRFDSPWMKGKYASDILSVYRTKFINSRRDDARATEATQKYIDNNYGKTGINGGNQWTKHPIEKTCGFNEGEGLPSIQRDMVRQISEPMAKLKSAYDDNKSDTYWSIEKSPPTKQKLDFVSSAVQSATSSTPFLTHTEPYEQLKFVKHTRNGVATDTETFPLKLVGNNFNWELNVETKESPMSIFLAAPEIGVHQYTPDVDWIRDDYLGRYHNFPVEKVAGYIKPLLNPSNKGNI